MKVLQSIKIYVYLVSSSEEINFSQFIRVYMNTFKVSAKVVNIYNNGFNEVNTTYKAQNKEKALQGFTDYLKSNRNIISFSNIKIEG